MSNFNSDTEIVALSSDSDAIWKAAEQGNVEYFNRFLIRNPSGWRTLKQLRADDTTGDSVLHRATRHERVELVRFLAANEACKKCHWMNLKNKMADGALHLAAARGFTNICEILVEAGAMINLPGGGGDNFEALGAWWNADTVKAMTNNFRGGILREAPLHTACRFGDNFKTVKRLVELGADKLAVNSFSSNALHIAAALGDVKSATYFLDQGIDVESRGKSGRTPLLSAIASVRKEMVDWLLDKGANYRAMTISGGTAIHLAAASGSKELVERMLGTGIDIDANDNDGETAYNWALINKEFDVADFLAAKGAKVGDLKPTYFLIRGKDRGRAAWHYIVVDELRKYRLLKERKAGENIDVEDYGRIEDSGWGEDPPPRVVDKMDAKYANTTKTESPDKPPTDIRIRAVKKATKTPTLVFI